MRQFISKLPLNLSTNRGLRPFSTLSFPNVEALLLQKDIDELRQNTHADLEKKAEALGLFDPQTTHVISGDLPELYSKYNYHRGPIHWMIDANYYLEGTTYRSLWARWSIVPKLHSQYTESLHESREVNLAYLILMLITY